MRTTQLKTMMQRAAFIVATAVSTFSAHAVTIDEVLNNMSPQVPNEAPIIDPRYDWQKHPMVITPAPRGDAIPSWWTGNRPEWMHTTISWFQIFEAQGNAATNTRVQVKNIRIYTLSEATRKWSEVDVREAPDVNLWQYPFNLASADAGKRAEAGGGISLKPAYPYFHHGYGNSKPITAPDVRAVYVSMDFRLVVDDANKPDDRASAKYVVNVGSDYYPGQGQGDWSLGYAPASGQGRFMQATSEWRSATMLVPNARNGSTLEEMRVTPPPMQ